MSKRLSVGRIGRAHGLRGELVVYLTTNRLERAEPGSLLFVGEPDGRALRVVNSRVLPNKSTMFVVQFGDVDGRSEAEELSGLELFADEISDEDELWVHHLIGKQVVDQSGVARGVVETVEANPASDLLVLNGGTLVPVAFVREITDEQIVVEVPEGLFDVQQ